MQALKRLFVTDPLVECDECEGIVLVRESHLIVHLRHHAQLQRAS